MALTRFEKLHTPANVALAEAIAMLALDEERSCS